MRLREILKEKKMSGSELARRIGVEPAYINMAASGKANLSVKKCKELADALDIPLASLFEGYTDPTVTVCPHCGKPIHLVGED